MTDQDSVERPAGSGRRGVLRRRALVVAWVAIAVAAASVASLLALSYSRVSRAIEQGSTAGLEGAHLEGEVGDQHFVVAYHDRTVVHGVLSLRNTSRLAVRIERVGERFGAPDAQWHGLVDERPDRNEVEPLRPDGAGPLPFAPFTLRPGEERNVGVALWLDNCEYNAPGAASTVVSVPVRYRALGMTYTAQVRLRATWEVRLGVTGGCPRS